MLQPWLVLEVRKQSFLQCVSQQRRVPKRHAWTGGWSTIISIDSQRSRGGWGGAQSTAEAKTSSPPLNPFSMRTWEQVWRLNSFTRWFTGPQTSGAWLNFNSMRFSGSAPGLAADATVLRDSTSRNQQKKPLFCFCFCKSFIYKGCKGLFCQSSFSFRQQESLNRVNSIT